MLDKALQRKVLDLEVRCLHKTEGCEWEGKLQYMSRHEKDECQWGSVECRYKCGEYIVRHQLTEHEQKSCKQRPIDVKMETLIHEMEERYKKEKASSKAEFESLLHDVREKHKSQAEQKEKEHAVEISTMKKMIEKMSSEMNLLKKSVEKLERKVVEKREIEQLRSAMKKKESSHNDEVKQIERKMDEQNKSFQIKINHLQESLNGR